jgi:hypothetical protein
LYRINPANHVFTLPCYQNVPLFFEMVKPTNSSSMCLLPKVSADQLLLQIVSTLSSKLPYSRMDFGMRKFAVFSRNLQNFAISRNIFKILRNFAKFRDFANSPQLLLLNRENKKYTYLIIYEINRECKSGAVCRWVRDCSDDSGCEIMYVIQGGGVAHLHRWSIYST